MKKLLRLTGFALIIGLLASCGAQTRPSLSRPSISSIENTHSQPQASSEGNIHATTSQSVLSDEQKHSSNTQEDAYTKYNAWQLQSMPEGPYTPVPGKDAHEILQGRWFFVPQLYNGWQGDPQKYGGHMFVFGNSSSDDMSIALSGYESGTAYVEAKYEALADGIFRATPYATGADGPSSPIEAFDFTFKVETVASAPGHLLITVLTYNSENIPNCGKPLLGGTYPFFSYDQFDEQNN